jgi:DNA adenine methylase
MKTRMKTKSALSWFGSDSEVAADLAALLDRCKHVTIPFVGGASILPHLKARAIVANDQHAQAINFYKCIAGVFGEESKQRTIQMCEASLSHPMELAYAGEMLSSRTFSDRAWGFWATCWIGRKGKGGTKGGVELPSVRWTAAGGTNASRIKAAAADLHAWAKEFERCEWQQLDFRLILAKVKDRADCGLYCDAPWIGAGDDYLHGFTEQDHSDLATMLGRFEQAAIVVRYGDHPLVRELYADWNIIEASSRTQANERTGEIWITRNV